MFSVLSNSFYYIYIILLSLTLSSALLPDYLIPLRTLGYCQCYCFAQAHTSYHEFVKFAPILGDCSLEFVFTTIFGAEAALLPNLGQRKVAQPNNLTYKNKRTHIWFGKW